MKWLWLVILLSGGIGALCRYALSGAIDASREDNGAASFPLGIWVANCVGCLLFGLLFALGEGRLPEVWRLAIFTGFLGSFTTFSTFSWNTLELMKTGQMGMALANVALSVVVGLLAVWGGYLAGSTLR